MSSNDELNEPRTSVTRTETVTLPAGTLIEVLNQDLALPVVGYLSERDCGLMPALVLRDLRRAVLFPGHWGALTGFDLAEAAVQNLVMVDIAAYTALRERAEDLLAFIKAMPATGVVRDAGALQ